MQTPFEQLGGEETVRRIAGAFYRLMDETEPELARLHRLDEQGHVHPEARERFALFFIGWLGGPQTYMERHGHPRLRMRHANVPVSEAMRDAWLRAMQRALDEVRITGDIRRFLDEKLADVAEFLRNA
ncbi:MAG: group II truncated hemoglobin [Deltaproteobacteria bacterium]|nr:group II truncated hemoglobin [Deltaproteobacteria bacterium]